MANTLELAMYNMHPTSTFPNDFHLFPPTDPHYAREAVRINPYTNDTIDQFPPGFREQVINPPGPDTGPYRSSLYDNYRVNNAAPIFPYDNPNMLNVLGSKFNQRWGAYMHKVCVTDNDLLRITNKDLGQWSSAPQGFTAYSQLLPHSSMRFI